MNDELLKTLRPVKRRLRTGRFCRGLAWGFAAGAAAALVLLAVTLFVPLENRWAAAGLALAGCIVFAAAGNALRPVGNTEAARAADGCGLQERTVTALEFSGGTADGKAAELIEAQRQDACAHLRALDPRKIRLSVPRRALLAGTVLLLLCAATALIRGEGDRIAGARKELAEKIAPMAEKIDQAEAEEEESLSEKEKAELRKLTGDLKRELSDSRDPVDALVALDKAESRLEAMRQKTAGDALQEMADAMRNAGMDAAAEALEGGDAQSLAQAAAEMASDGMQQAAEGLSEEAKALAEQLAQALQQGELTDAQLQAMMAAAAQNSASQASPLQQALSGMKASLGSKPSASSGMSGMQGPGNGQGQNGGAGTGTTNEEQKGSGNSQAKSASKGNRPPEYKEGEYETIYDPEKAETASRNVSTEQNKQAEDSVQIEVGPGKGSLDGNVPFREVVGEYAQAEVQAAESALLTGEQKQWVDDYYRRLTDD